MNKYPTVAFRDYELNTIYEGIKIPYIKKFVFSKLLINLEEAINKDRKQCILCHVKEVTDDKFSSPKYQVIIPSEQFIDTLKSLEDYYSEIEDYKTCAKIIKLKNIIENGKG